MIRSSGMFVCFFKEHNAPRPHSGVSRGLQGLSPHIHFILVPLEVWFRLKSRSSHPLPGYLLAAQRSICLFHGCKLFFNQCVTLGNNKLFTKGVPCVEK